HFTTVRSSGTPCFTASRPVNGYLIGPSVALVSYYHLFNNLPLGQRGRVDRLTGGRKAARDHSTPARVKSDGKPEPTRRLCREIRPAWSRPDGLKPDPHRMIYSYHNHFL